MRLIRSLIVCALVPGAILGLPDPAEAGLIGMSTRTDSVYTIDASSGAATFLVKASGDFAGVGLTYLNGSLYASDLLRYENGNFPSTGLQVARVDMVTGAVTPFTLQAGSINWHGLASDASSGNMYAVALDQQNMLMKVDLTGSVSAVGPTGGPDGRGLVFDPNTKVLYATSNANDSLYRIDTNTGVSSLVGPLGLDAVFLDLALDYINGIMYANIITLNDGEGALYRVNLLTGATTLVGMNNAPFIDGMAWIPDFDEPAPIPEPRTYAMILAGLGLLRFMSWRRTPIDGLNYAQVDTVGLQSFLGTV